jgi:ABC-type multidrug transport system fused ATPase/permease subunit
MLSSERTRRPPGEDTGSRVPKEDVMPLLDLFWSMLVFFLWISWFWLLISIFADIFRSDDLSGWGKSGWVLFTVFLPFLGVLVYLIARGQSMQDRAMRQQRELEEANAAYIRGVASAPSTTEELARLAQLHDSGALTAEEFAAQKAKVLAS